MELHSESTPILPDGVNHNPLISYRSLVILRLFLRNYPAAGTHSCSPGPGTTESGIEKKVKMMQGKTKLLWGRII